MNPTPKHVALIMDGNGRWAKNRHHPRSYGHLRGVQTAKKIMLSAREAGIRYLTLYTFSMENWNRPLSEVQFLMRLIERYFTRERDFLIQEGIRICVMGQLEPVPQQTHTLIEQTQAVTAHCEGIQVNLAFSYSSRQEILNAISKLKKTEHVSPADLRAQFYLPDVPDPELVIRTGGVNRLSNFLLWQAAYAELFFSKKLWPDFSPHHLQEALTWYATQDRKFGTI
jgi:undecaprenyl diphosphate synthase